MSELAFDLPALDDDASVETGVILLGFDAQRLVAGLGFASLTDDPALVALTVDHLRHDVPAFTLDGAVDAGLRRWVGTRPALAAADPGPPPPAASLRQVWSATVRVLASADIGPAGPATRAYLTACWIRRYDVDRMASSTIGA